jgi:DNA-binding protein H-NS
MPTYAEYMKQIAELQALAEEARRNEIEEAKTKIREIMQASGIALDDLQADKKKVDKVRSSVAPKYKDPTTGKTWTGRGRAPAWLNGRNKDDFLIN